MKKVVFAMACLLNFVMVNEVKAKSVIFLIGDGMGYNHINCVNKDHTLFLSSKTPSFVKTASFDNEVTDSAASATAYSCGIKTNNLTLAMDPQGQDCKTLAEKAVERGKKVYIATTDNKYGATPSAFYAHTKSRYDNPKIDHDRHEARENMELSFDVASLADKTREILSEIADDNENEYFIVLEGAYIDKGSHNNDYNKMEKAMLDFDEAVRIAWDFAQEHSFAIVVTADHETGGLMADACRYTVGNHTAADVPLYMDGVYNNLEAADVYDNTDVYKIIDNTLF